MKDRKEKTDKTRQIREYKISSKYDRKDNMDKRGQHIEDRQKEMEKRR